MPITCPKCEQRGYYELLVKAEAGQDQKSMVMFCKCENGARFREITIDFRLNDLSSFADEVLPMVKKARETLHKPEESGKILKELEDQIQALLTRIKESAKD